MKNKTFHTAFFIITILIAGSTAACFSLIKTDNRNEIAQALFLDKNDKDNDVINYDLVQDALRQKFPIGTKYSIFADFVTDFNGECIKTKNPNIFRCKIIAYSTICIADILNIEVEVSDNRITNLSSNPFFDRC